MNGIVQEWLDKAQGDFATLGREAAVVDDPNYDAVYFHAQQCGVEKLMKGVLIARGTADPPKIHDLGKLHLLLLDIEPRWSANEGDLERLTQAAVDIRYPGVETSPSDAAWAMKVTRRLRADLLALLE